ncbi:hypothetical protein [Shewanella livingstonensis]|uniref:Uncharacterized protein n=1 Tax=Shewanella livingstonensis TaxID=150120 RepID=A0A3G8LX91_9GAMM|nr:hypothetical protein [Shewanella livingstonensis]AZG74107.1 hypothetical protein EGC82_15915 [Shewanella livingstonensis]
MAVPTTLPKKAVNTVTFKPADASQQPVPQDKKTQIDSTSLPTKTTNDKSVSSTPSSTKSDLAAALLPVKVLQPPTSAQLNVTIENQQYQLNKTAELQKLLQQTTQVVIASDQAKLVARATASVNQPTAQAEVISNQVTPSTLTSASTASATVSPPQTVTTQLVLLAQPILFALPQALEELAKQNGVSTQQLATLATRAQGYPLPTAVIDQGQLTFFGGTSIKLASNTSLSSGQYLAKVVVQNQQLQLALTPVIAEISVNLAKLNSPQTIQPLQTENIVITKNEPAQILSQFLKKLESTPLPSNNNVTKAGDTLTNINTGSASVMSQIGQNSSTAKTAVPITQQAAPTLPPETNLAKTSIDKTQPTTPPQSAITSPNTLKADTAPIIIKNDLPNKLTTDPAPIEVLNKALSKAGAMPIKQQLTQQIPHNLASELFKHLPQIGPHPLSALSDPALLSSELYSLAALNLAQTQLGHTSSSQTSPLFSGSAIASLFQILLGVKTKSTGTAISDKLQAHLAQLQQRTLSKLSANSGLLAALDKLGGTDSLAQLASSIALYQHASTDPNQAMTWYFALPYSINQRDEQFEGKFEQETDPNTDKKAGWKLQLKFNLAQGSLLICVHKQAEVLDIQFKGNNQMLLTKVERFNQALSEKISQIGFTPGKLTTQLAQIPATLLPGDHYLVKTRA